MPHTPFMWISLHLDSRRISDVAVLQLASCSLPIIYPIICLKSVCLATFAILDRSPRDMCQTDRIHPRYFLSRVRVSIRPRIFVYGKKPQTTVARPAAVDRRSVADKQLNLNGRNPFSPRSSVPRAQRENVVAECSDHG